MSTREIVEVGDTHFEVDLLGHGEPVVVIQTALQADELLPLSAEIARVGHRVIHYHRRGYAGSSAASGPHSLAGEASDCHNLIEALGRAPVHVVGVSFSAAIALTVASTYPEIVGTLTIIEPPPVRSTSTEDFFELTARLVECYRTQGEQLALDQFMEVLMGPDWRVACERDLPGSVAVDRGEIRVAQAGRVDLEQ